MTDGEWHGLIFFEKIGLNVLGLLARKHIFGVFDSQFDVVVQVLCYVLGVALSKIGDEVADDTGVQALKTQKCGNE